MEVAKETFMDSMVITDIMIITDITMVVMDRTTAV